VGQKAISGASQRLSGNFDTSSSCEDWDDWLDTDEHSDSDADED
jgi:hypothetical protein